MIISYQDLETETLEALVESFVLREGTDYGDAEVSLSAKTEQILAQVIKGDILIIYSELHESCDLVPASQFQK
ncbi:MAG: YheU family protein [Gammaproteobacteria bacterium]|nr:YheU family protein [Gammaproteobacteria bacterium]